MTPLHPPQPRGRSVRGALTCLAMFALGGAVLWGLFLSPRATSPRSPQQPWGAPPRPLRFVSFDCNSAGADDLRQTLNSIRDRDPDFVMLQRVPAGDLLSFVEGLRFQQSHYTQLFQRTGPGGHDESGCLVLSKHPLYEARGIRPDGPRGACMGTWAVAAIDGVRFAVVSARMGGMDGGESLLRAWHAAGSPPVVLGIAAPPQELRSPRSTAGEWFAARGDGPIFADSGWHVVASESGGPPSLPASADLCGTERAPPR